jgi:hypothetical protein
MGGARALGGRRGGQRRVIARRRSGVEENDARSEWRRTTCNQNRGGGCGGRTFPLTRDGSRTTTVLGLQAPALSIEKKELHKLLFYTPILGASLMPAIASLPTHFLFID